MPKSDLIDSADRQLPVSANGMPIPQVQRAPGLVRFAVTMALVGCVVGMGWALSMHQDTKGPEDAVIEQLTPAPGSETVPGQTPIIIDLAFGYDVEITIDDKLVPRDKVTEVESLGQFKVDTDPSNPLTNAPHVVQIVYWPKIGDRTRDAQVYEWRFKVV